ncbi:MAG: hypothetical protein M1837_004613 [Sclerophora amabilis]|nr:MAG: hypothetical protein M1837_004613 [Sclerophora amabilis]
MAEGAGGHRNDWRRKFTTSSGASKSTSKDSSRSKQQNDPKANRTVAASSKSIPPSPTSTKSSNSLSALKSETYKAETGSEESPPIFGSASGGFRSTLFRSGRDRALSNREESVQGVGLVANDESTPKGAKPVGRHERTPMDSQGSELVRKTSSLKKDTRPPSTDQGSSSETSSDDEDGGKGSKRGSVIEKVAQRAKLVLPMKRSKESGRLEKSKDLSTKSSSSSSALQSSTRGVTHLSLSSSEDDENDANNADRNPHRSVTTLDNSSVPGRKQRVVPQSSGDVATSPAVSAANVRPKAVPPRSTSSDAIHQMQDPAANKPGLVIKSHKIMEMSPSDLKSPVSSQDSIATRTPSRSATNGSASASSRHKKPSMNSIREVSNLAGSEATTPDDATSQSKPGSQRPSLSNRPSALRSTSAIKLNSLSHVSTLNVKKSVPIPPPRTDRRPPTFEPPIHDPQNEPKLDTAPPSGMYWSKAPFFGHDHTSLRAHTATLVGGNIFVFGGCDSKNCFNELYVFDADCMFWSSPDCTGDIPPPLRAMTATAVGKKIVYFGGGDGPSYYNDVYVLDTLNFRFTKPAITGAQPSKRRAHTACFYRNGIYIFGGGDGNKALNDVWRLDVSDVFKPTWKLISPPSKTSGARPTARGYHTTNLVGSKLIVYGGSDGVECFNDVWIFDVETLVWKQVEIKHSYRRLSHSATIVGSYLFVVGGHDGSNYSSDVLLLNLVTMHWDQRKTYGVPPSGRGYHGAVLHDSRLFVIGGFDG